MGNVSKSSIPATPNHPQLDRVNILVGGMENTLENLFQIYSELSSAGFSVAVFGGWAEELLGLRAAGRHGDIDLLIFDEQFNDFDEWLRRNGQEVIKKRYPHKRAFRRGSLLVELILVTQDSVGSHITTCHGHRLTWPLDKMVCIRLSAVGQLLVACPAYLIYYRNEYPAVAAARRQIEDDDGDHPFLNMNKP